jgi:hypothetical protein
MKSVFGIFLSLALFCNEASAGIRLHGSASSGVTAAGHAQINIGGIDLLQAPFMNLMKVSEAGGTPQPTSTDVYGYPVATLSSNLNASPYVPDGFLLSSTKMVLKWSATRAITLVLNQSVNVTNCFTTPTCVIQSTGGQTVAGTGAQCTTSDPLLGNSCRVEFYINSYSGGDLSMFYPSGTQNYAPGSGDLIMVRASDEAALNAGSIFTSEYINFLTNNGTINWETVRPMGWANVNNGNEVNWNYRTQPHSLTYYPEGNYPPNALGGVITGTDAYTIPAATDTPLSGWVDGEVIIGNNSNAPTLITVSAVANNGSGLCRLTVNATTALTTGQTVLITNLDGTNGCISVPPAFSTITVIDSGCSSGSCRIDIQGSSFSGSYHGAGVVGFQTLTVTGKSGGSRLIASGTAFAINGNCLQPGIDGGYSTFIYSKVINMLLCYQNSGTAGGVTGSVPVEVRAALANALKANFWDNVPALANNTYITNQVTAAHSVLKPNLKYKPELANELFNTSFLAFFQFNALGSGLGWPTSGNGAAISYQALRTLQITQLASAVWGALGPTSRLQPVLGAQSNTYYVNLFNTYFATGSLLNPNTYPALCTYLGGTYAGSTCTGATDYSNPPNRPIDIAQYGIIAYANYFQGALWNAGQNCPAYTGPNCGGLSSYNSNLMQTMLTDYAAGGSGITTAEALLDQDIRAGIFNSYPVTFSGSTLTVSGNPFVNNDVAVFATTGTFPSCIANGTTGFFVSGVSGNNFNIAHYIGGSALSCTGGSGTLTIGPTDWIAGLGGGNYNGGNSGTLADLIYTVYGSNNGTLLGWQNLITSNGYTQHIENYEGGPSLTTVAPTSAQCTANGWTAPPLGGGTPTAAGCAAQASALLTAWLNSTFAYNTVHDWAEQSIGNLSSAGNFGLVTSNKSPSVLTIPPGNDWSLCSAGPPSPACYQTFSAYGAFSNAP